MKSLAYTLATLVSVSLVTAQSLALGEVDYEQAEREAQIRNETIFGNYIENIQLRIDSMGKYPGCHFSPGHQMRPMRENLDDISNAVGSVTYEGDMYLTEKMKADLASINPDVNKNLPEFLEYNLGYKLKVNLALEQLDYESPDPHGAMIEKIINELPGSHFYSGSFEPDELSEIRLGKDGALVYFYEQGGEAKTGSYTAEYLGNDPEQFPNIKVTLQLADSTIVYFLKIRNQYSFGYFDVTLEPRTESRQTPAFSIFNYNCAEE